MSAPALLGLHHLKLPVSDLDASIDWYGWVSTPNTCHSSTTSTAPVCAMR